MKYSKDFYEVAETLSYLCMNGLDYEQEQVILYDVVVPDRETGERLSQRLRTGEFNPSLFYEAESSRWLCRCPVKMRLDADDLVWIYEKIEERSQEYEGEMDGWSIILNK